MLLLGSQSPRRRELLAMLLPEDRFRVEPPADGREQPFVTGWDLPQIESHLLQVARLKNAAVRQSGNVDNTHAPILTADTIIVGFEESQQPVVLGKPPEATNEQNAVVREWFHRYYLGREHLAKSALCFSLGDGRTWDLIVTTRVRFRGDATDVEWYLQTGELAGKAGGYAIQGAGAMFVEAIEGSLSNIVGLPLRETRDLLRMGGLL